MNNFLYLCIAIGIMLSEANASNLRKSKAINFESKKSIYDVDEISGQVPPMDVEDNDDELLLYQPDIEVYYPTPVKYCKHYFESDDDTYDDDYYNATIEDDYPNAPQNTPYCEVVTDDFYWDNYNIPSYVNTYINKPMYSTPI